MMHRRVFATVVLVSLPMAAGASMEVVGQLVPPAGVGNSQTTRLVDLDGDGKLEILDSMMRQSEDDPPWAAVSEGAVRVVEYDAASGALRVRRVLIPNSPEVVATGTQPVVGGQLRVVVAGSDGTLAAFRPRAQEPHVRHSLNRPLDAARFVDADRNGTVEAIVAGRDGLSSHDLVTGSTQWSIAGYSPGIDVGQLDDDPALEIVQVGSVGSVIDGATRAVDWQYAGGFGGAVAVGRVGPGGARGFVTGDALTWFRAQPYSPLWSVKRNVQQLHTFDIDGDLVDEVIVGNASFTEIYDSETQEVLYMLNGGRNLVLGDVDRNGSVEAVGWFYVGNDSVSGVLGLDGTAIAADANETGLLSRVAIDDADADGIPEALVISGGRSERGWLRGLDLIDGRERWRKNLDGIDPLNQPLSIRAQRVAQLDGDSAKEIVLAARNSFRTRLVVLDGASREPQVVNTSEVFDTFEFVSHVEVLAAEPRVLTVSRSGTQLRIRRFTADALVAQAVAAIPAQFGTALYDVHVVNLDADGAEELLLATNSHLVAFDLATSSVRWALPGATAAVGVVDASPSTPRIVRLAPDGTLALLTFSGAADSTSIDVGTSASAVSGVPEVPGEVFVCADDRVKRIALDDGQVLDLSPNLGAQACRGGDLAVATMPAGFRVLAGSLVGAFLLEPSGDRFFRDGFE